MAGLLKTHENDDIAQAIRAEIVKDLSRHRSWYIFAGILFIAFALAVSMALYGASLLALAWNAGT